MSESTQTATTIEQPTKTVEVADPAIKTEIEEQAGLTPGTEPTLPEGTEFEPKNLKLNLVNF